MKLFDLLQAHPSAVLDIVQHTPVWVGVVLAALIALGVSQWRDRTVAPLRLLVLPAVLTAMSLWGIAQAFAHSEHLAAVLGLWLLCVGVVMAFIGRRAVSPRDRFEPATRLIHVAGSPIALAVIVVIFLVRYVVNVELAINPSAAQHIGFSLAVGATYGLLSGLAFARNRSLWALKARTA